MNQQRPGALPIRPDGTAPSETIDTRVPHPAVQDTPQNPPLSNPAPPEAPDTAKEAPPPAATEEVSQTIPEKAPEAKEPEAPPKPATPEPEPVIVLKPGIDGAFETTISEQCMQTVEAAQQEIEASQQTMEAIDAEQTELLSQLSASRRAKVDGIRSIKVKSQELEDAIEKEQYDVAAMLETEVAELRSIVSDDDISADSEELRSRLNDLLVRKLALWEEEAAVHQETVDKLRDMTHLQEEEIKAFEFDLDAATADEKGDIDARRSKLAKTKNHLDVDQQHHDEEIARVNKLSDERSAAFKNEKQRLVSTQTEVQDRIAELKQELNRLELEDEELTKNIAVQDERIEHAESGLSADRKRMEEESQQLAETRGTLAADQQKLDLDNARLEDSTAELRAKREELDISLRQTREHVAFAIRAKHENIVLTTAVADFQEQYELVLDPFSVSGGGDENLVQLKTDLTEKTESVKTLTNSVLQMQSTASSLRKSLEDIATRVPELQQSKKVAVSGRNFKEAQRLQEEVKTLESEQVEQTVELKELNASLLTETEALDAAKEMEAKLSEDWKTKEVGFDTAAIKELRAKNDELREKILGLKSGSTEIAKLIRIDAEACELLEEQLSIKHGLEFVAPEQSLDDLVATALLGAHSQNLLLILDDPVAEDESADFAAEQASAEQDNVTPIMGDLASLDMGHDRTLPLEPTEAGEDDATAQDVEADDTTETAEVVASVDDATQAAATEDVTTTSTAGDDQTESDDGGNGGDGGDAAVEADVDSNADTNEDTNTEIDVDPEPTPVEPVANDDTAAEPEADEGDAVDIEGIKAQIATLEADMEIALAEEDYDACEHIHDNIEALKAQLPESDTSELKRAR